MHKNFLFNNLEELMNYSNNYKGSDPLKWSFQILLFRI